MSKQVAGKTESSHRTSEPSWHVCRDCVLLSSSLLQAEIEEAARLANAHGFISSLPNGYATQVCTPGCFKLAAPVFHAA